MTYVWNPRTGELWADGEPDAYVPCGEMKHKNLPYPIRFGPNGAPLFCCLRPDHKGFPHRDGFGKTWTHPTTYVRVQPT